MHELLGKQNVGDKEMGVLRRYKLEDGILTTRKLWALLVARYIRRCRMGELLERPDDLIFIELNNTVLGKARGH